MNSLLKTGNQVYADPVVYRRFLDFLGGSCDKDVTAVYLTHTDGCRMKTDSMQSASDGLRALIDEGVDIDRSLLDKKSLLVHLDIEYVNYDSPLECYLNAERSFKLQEPVIEVIDELLLKYGIRPLHLLTGQGHHFIWSVGKKTRALAKLCALAPDHIPDGSAFPDNSIGLENFSNEWDAAFAGLGRVMEFLAHEIKVRAALKSRIPVEVTAIHTGNGVHGYREMISIDISEYGDPLWTRVIRLPFSNYLKPWRSGLVDQMAENRVIPPIFTIPLHEIDVYGALEIRNSSEKTMELAHRACVIIPKQSRGMDRLIDSYRESSLLRFHEAYDAECVTSDIDMTSVKGKLPPCAAHVVENPNDLLLKPSGMRLVVRCLLGLGIGPRQIGHMIAQIFSDGQYDWEDQWDIYSPAMRAHFYTRLFAGQIATGLDEAVDFNCVSAQEQGFCFDAKGCNLKPWRDRLVSNQKEKPL